jgi:hypothetical protein
MWGTFATNNTSEYENKLEKKCVTGEDSALVSKGYMSEK